MAANAKRLEHQIKTGKLSKSLEKRPEAPAVWHLVKDTSLTDSGGYSIAHDKSRILDHLKFLHKNHDCVSEFDNE